MGNEAIIVRKNELEANPTAIGESLVQLAQSLEDNKTDLSQIKERGFWQKLANNNTRDLAEAMIKQNETITGFLTIVQGVIFLSMNNIVALGSIMDSLEKSEHQHKLRDNTYFQLAKEYLSEAILTAEKAVDNEKKLKKLNLLIREQDHRAELQKNEIGMMERTVQTHAQNLHTLEGNITEVAKGVAKHKERFEQQDQSFLALEEEYTQQKIELRQLKDALSTTNEKLEAETNHVRALSSELQQTKADQAQTSQDLERMSVELQAQTENLTTLSSELDQAKRDQKQLANHLEVITTSFQKRLLYAYVCGGLGILVGALAMLL